MDEEKRKAIKKQLICTYMEQGKNEFILRLRGFKENPQIICYYKGIKVFEFSDVFELNKAVFLPNNTNDKANKERVKMGEGNIEILEEPRKRANKIEECGFQFKLEKEIHLPFSDKIQYEKESKETIQILEHNRDTIQKLLSELGINISQWNLKQNDKKRIIGYVAEITNCEEVDYPKIYQLILSKYGWSNHLKSITEERKYTGLKSLELDIKCELVDFAKMLENFEQFNAVMKKAIEVYALKPEKIVKTDFSNTREDSEKAYQQKLMLVLNNNQAKRKIVGEKNSPFDEIDLPFEMEYVIYPSPKKKTTNSKREQANRKGRLDNIVISAETETLKLIEIKIDSDVIGKTNGIHKHLLDLANCVQKNPNFVKEILEHARTRKEILTATNVQGDNFAVPNTFQKIEYCIICGYTDDACKKRVIDTYNLIKDKTILDAEVFFATDEYAKQSKVEYEEFTKDLRKRNKQNIANEYDLDLLDKTVAEYCEILSNPKEGIPPIEVKILLADENFENFEPLN